jgi:hypothetical protein
MVAVKLVKLHGYRSKDKKLPMAKIVIAALDEDVKNLKLITDEAMGGKDKHGEDLGRQFITVLNSTGTDVEKIHANAANGVKMSNTQIFQALEGKEGYVEIEADVWDGQEITRVKNWITKERYEQAAVAAAGAAANFGGTNGAATGAAAPTGTSQMPML